MRTLLKRTAKLAAAVAATGGLLVAAPVAAHAGTAGAAGTATTVSHAGTDGQVSGCTLCGF